MGRIQAAVDERGVEGIIENAEVSFVFADRAGSIVSLSKGKVGILISHAHW